MSVSNPQNRSIIYYPRLSGHECVKCLQKITLKNDLFMSHLLYLQITARYMSVCEILITELVFLRWVIWGVTCLVKYSQNECYAIYLLGNPIYECWYPQNRAHLCSDNRFWGVPMPRYYSREHSMFSNISHWTPQNSVLKPSEQWSQCSRWCDV